MALREKEMGIPIRLLRFREKSGWQNRGQRAVSSSSTSLLEFEYSHHWNSLLGKAQDCFCCCFLFLVFSFRWREIKQEP